MRGLALNRCSPRRAHTCSPPLKGMAEARRLATATAAHRWLGQTSWRDCSLKNNATGPSPLSGRGCRRRCCCGVQVAVLSAGDIRLFASVFFLLCLCVCARLGGAGASEWSFFLRAVPVTGRWFQSLHRAQLQRRRRVTAAVAPLRAVAAL